MKFPVFGENKLNIIFELFVHPKQMLVEELERMIILEYCVQSVVVLYVKWINRGCQKYDLKGHEKSKHNKV